MDVYKKNNEELENLCRNLKWLRIQKGVSVKELSKETGVFIRTLERLEEGELSQRFTVECFFRLCGYYQVGSNKLLKEKLWK